MWATFVEGATVDCELHGQSQQARHAGGQRRGQGDIQQQAKDPTRYATSTALLSSSFAPTASLRPSTATTRTDWVRAKGWKWMRPTSILLRCSWSRQVRPRTRTVRRELGSCCVESWRCTRRRGIPSTGWPPTTTQTE